MMSAVVVRWWREDRPLDFHPPAFSDVVPQPEISVIGFNRSTHPEVLRGSSSVRLLQQHPFGAEAATSAG